MSLKDRLAMNWRVAKSLHQDMQMDNRGQTSITAKVIGITVAAIVIAFVGTVGVDQLADTGISSNASSGATSIYNILDLIVVLAFLLMLLSFAVMQNV